MDSLEYEFIRGHRRGSELLYIPSEKQLFVQKSKLTNVKSFVCYQSILKQNKKNKENIVSCTARVTINNENICVRKNIAHSCHLMNRLRKI